MGVKFANNAYGTLNASISTSDASLTLASGQGARFPSLGAGDFFYCTLIDTSNNLEVVKCTARASDVLTITRAQESTTARAFTVGARVELRVTAAGLEDNLDNTDIDVILPTQTGNSGEYLTTDGTNASWGTVTVPTSLGLQSMQVFTSTGSSTWTKPAGITKVKVYVTGGGGGGGATNDDDMANGGGAGGTAIKLIDVTSVSSVSVTVGAGGAGAGNNNPNASVRGGTSSFGSYCSATGGDRTGGNWGVGGDGGTATGGDINLSGSDGIGGLIDNTGNNQAAGTGGASFWGQGGKGSTRGETARTAGEAYGSGGGGGADSETGASGANGIVVVEEYK